MKLKAEGLIKSYKGRKVVKGITVEVNQGEIVGLLGPNGAGKTTTIRVLLGLLKKTSGSGKVLGMDISTQSLQIRKKNLL